MYKEVIRPAVDAAGLQCIRADEEHVGGIIHKPMFERLLLCDYAVADLSTANANVYYELGVRHATRPWSTVLVFREDFRLPFDVGALRGLPYELDDAGRPSRAAIDRIALTRRLHEARTQTTDSPLFQLLDGLIPPDVSALSTDVFHERIKASTAFQEKLARASRADDAAAVRAVQAELGDLRDVETGLIIDLLLSYRALNAHVEMTELVTGMSHTLARTALSASSTRSRSTVSGAALTPSTSSSGSSTSGGRAARPTGPSAGSTRTSGTRRGTPAGTYSRAACSTRPSTRT